MGFPDLDHDTEVSTQAKIAEAVEDAQATDKAPEKSKGEVVRKRVAGVEVTD